MGSLKDYKFWLNLFLGKEKNFSYKEYLLSSFGVLGSKIKTFLKTISGTILSFDDGLAKPAVSLIAHIEPEQDLHGYDAPWPAGGGVNLLDLSNVNGNTVYGFITTINRETGLVTISGTYSNSSPNASFAFLLGLPYIENTNVFAFEMNTALSEHLLYTSKPIRWANTNGNLAIDLKNLTQDTAYTFTLKPLICKNNVTPIAWTPYSNICPITGHTETNVTRTGKNLIPKLQSVVKYNGITFAPNPDGSISISGTATGNAFCNIVTSDYLLKAGTYTLSGGQSNNVLVFVRYNNTAGTAFLQSTGAKQTSVTDVDITVGIGIRIASGTTIDTILYPQLELGSTATDYEPYQGETYPITFPTEAGTVYGGYVDVTNGKLVVDRAMANVTATADNGIASGNQQIAFTAPGKKGGLTNFVSNLFKNSAGAYGMTGRVSTAVVEFRVPLDVLNVTASDSSATRMAAFAEWFSNNPTQLCYELATPIEYDITPQQIALLKGYNNVWNSTGGNNELTYIGTKKGN